MGLEVGLELQGGDPAAGARGHDPGRTAEARADIEHPAGRGDVERTDSLLDRLRTEIVILVEGRQDLNGQGVVIADAGVAQIVVDPFHPGVELHGLDGRRVQGPVPALLIWHAPIICTSRYVSPGTVIGKG